MKIYLSSFFNLFDLGGVLEMHACIVGELCSINCSFECVYRMRCHFLYI